MMRRLLFAFLRTGAARWLSRRVIWRIDPLLLRVTRGRLGLTKMLPTALLETRGARTGQVRRNAVICIRDGDAVTIIASKLGMPQHPAWYFNARANPDVRLNGESYRAQEVTDPAERERLWRLADEVFPVFADYRARAAEHGRTIPILQLTRARAT